jgi:N-glycosylase/DNA lyase
MSIEPMEKLIVDIEKLRNSEIKEIIDTRLHEYKEAGKKANEDIFSELCFVILAAHYSAEGSFKIQNDVRRGFCNLSEEALVAKLRQHGHRFPEARAKYIIEARKHIGSLKTMIEQHDDERQLREWFVRNVKGIGIKTASQFLRNIGYENLAIVDFHIIDVLMRYGIIERPKALTTKKYLEIENTLKQLAKKLDMNLAELDLYLWYMETGKILK